MHSFRALLHSFSQKPPLSPIHSSSSVYIALMSIRANFSSYSSQCSFFFTCLKITQSARSLNPAFFSDRPWLSCSENIFCVILFNVPRAKPALSEPFQGWRWPYTVFCWAKRDILEFDERFFYLFIFGLGWR